MGGRFFKVTPMTLRYPRYHDVYDVYVPTIDGETLGRSVVLRLGSVSRELPSPESEAELLLCKRTRENCNGWCSNSSSKGCE